MNDSVRVAGSSVGLSYTGNSVNLAAVKSVYLRIIIYFSFFPFTYKKALDIVSRMWWDLPKVPSGGRNNKSGMLPDSGNDPECFSQEHCSLCSPWPYECQSLRFLKVLSQSLRGLAAMMWLSSPPDSLSAQINVHHLNLSEGVTSHQDVWNWHLNKSDQRVKRDNHSAPAWIHLIIVVSIPYKLNLS